MNMGMFLFGFIVGAVVGVVLISSTSISSDDARLREKDELRKELMSEELDEDLKAVDK